MASIIDTTEPVPVDTLTTFHKNPRRSDQALLRESLATLGQYKPIVVNVGTKTGRAREVLAGNHTLIEARRLGWKTVDVAWVDVDDERAAKIALIDNRAGDRGSYDEEMIAELLSDMADLVATGYSTEDLAKMVASDPEPDPAPQLGGLQFRIVIDCTDEEHQAELLGEFESRGLPARPLIS